jgi:hypothetical protein
MEVKSKLILESEWDTSSVEFKNVDVSLEQYFNAFKGILIQQTWSESQINEYILELAEEIRDY